MGFTVPIQLGSCYIRVRGGWDGFLVAKSFGSNRLYLNMLTMLAPTVLVLLRLQLVQRLRVRLRRLRLRQHP